MSSVQPIFARDAYQLQVPKEFSKLHFMRISALQAPSITVHPFRIAIPCPWHLLNHEEAAFCWQAGPEGDVWFALGPRREFSSLEECREALRQIEPSPDIQPRGFAILAFDSSRHLPAPWREFPARQIILPQLLLRWHQGEAVGAVLGAISEGMAESFLSGLWSPVSGLSGSSLIPVILDTASSRASRTSSLTEHSLFSREEWRKAVRSIQAEIARGALQKVVLSRQVTLETRESMDSSSILEALSRDAEDCILFAYHQPGAGVFLGASPEGLFRVRQRHLTVDSLAGTRPRGKTPEEDERLAHELSHSPKDRREQELVTKHLLASLQEYCDHIHTEKTPQVRRLSSVQHLHTSIAARLRAETSLDDLLNTLHPTPATCGLPVARARELIAELEPEPRGLYAGVIGWISTDEAEFAVMIRSGLIRGNTARLFGGAGIVTESDPDAEFDECEWKMEPLRCALLRVTAEPACPDKGRIPARPK